MMPVNSRCIRLCPVIQPSAVSTDSSKTAAARATTYSPSIHIQSEVVVIFPGKLSAPAGISSTGRH